MRISNRRLLSAIFALKGNFARAASPPSLAVDGVEIAPFRNDAPAAACISADFELSWAWREWDPAFREMRARRARDNFPYLLGLLEEFQMPVTWATVGHLFLKSCRRGPQGQAHSDMPRPAANRRWEGDWYRHDPCTDFRKDPLWYAPDLIEKMIDSPLDHEIASHSFSHIEYSAAAANCELVRRETEECIAAMAPYGLRPRSLVYPFNIMGHSYLELLSNMGITAVRHRDPRVRLSYPERDASGVYKLYESMNLRDPSRYDYLHKAQIFLDRAARRRALYHLWFHPSDERAVFEGPFARILAELAQRRQEGRLWVATMQEIAAYTAARSQTRLSIAKSGQSVKVTLRSELDFDRFGVAGLTLLIPVPHPPRRVSLLNSKGEKADLHPNRLKAGKLMVTLPADSRLVELIL